MNAVLTFVRLAKTLMTAGDVLAGYKTYIVAFFTVAGTVSLWGTNTVIPFIDHQLTITQLINQSYGYLVTISAAFGASSIRAALDR